MTGVELLAKAAADYLAAQRESSVRADKDREAYTAATAALVRWTKAYVVITAIAVAAALIGLYMQAHPPLQSP